MKYYSKSMNTQHLSSRYISNMDLSFKILFSSDNCYFSYSMKRLFFVLIYCQYALFTSFCSKISYQIYRNIHLRCLPVSIGNLLPFKITPEVSCNRRDIVIVWNNFRQLFFFFNKLGYIFLNDLQFWIAKWCPKVVMSLIFITIWLFSFSH